MERIEFIDRKKQLIVKSKEREKYKCISVEEKESLSVILDILNKYNYNNRKQIKGLITRTIIDSLTLDYSIAELYIEFDDLLK